MKKGSPYLVDILRGVVASDYKYTLYTAVAGVPVTFDFSSKDIDKLSVHYEFSPSFILKAQMGLYDRDFSTRYSLMKWVDDCRKAGQRSWDIEYLLNNFANFYAGDSIWLNQFPMDQNKGFLDFVSRCLTEFPRAFDRDVLKKYECASSKRDGLMLYDEIRKLADVWPHLKVVLFSSRTLARPSAYDFGVTHGEVAGMFYDMGDYAFRRYEPDVVDYLKKKLELE